MTPRFIAVPLIGFIILLVLGVSWEVAFLLTGPLMLISISHYLTAKAIEEQLTKELSASNLQCPPHEWEYADDTMKCKKCSFKVSND